MTVPIDLSLLPRTATLDDAGRLAVGGCDLAALADRFGTPLFVYDEEELRGRCREYAAEFGAGHVAYAGKAFLCRAMASLVDEEGLLLDVATGGELHIALSAGFPAERVVMHGNNKSDDELRAALDAGVGRIVVDSFDEIDRLERLSGGVGRQKVLVRVTPGVSGDTHAHIDTGIEDSKFGFSVTGGIALEAARRIAASPALELTGLHAHIGSQITRAEPYSLAADVVGRLVKEVEDVTGAPVEEVNLGGGLAVRYGPEDLALGMRAYAEALRNALPEGPRLMVEPGRSIAGPAGLTLYRVGTIKDIPGVRTYVAVDGGMSDNPRPATYGARYEAFLPARAAAGRPRLATVAGKHCEQGDVLVRDAHLPEDIAVGDVLCTPATGAYGYSMASNYNAVPRPAVVFVRDGEARPVIRRETLDDLLRLDENRV